jgi:hypothetical protein
MKEYRVQTLQNNGWHTALITVFRHEAETHYEKLAAWANEHKATLPGGGRVALVAYLNGQEEEVIRDNRPTPVLVTADREWQEDEDGEPIRRGPSDYFHARAK